MNQATFGSQEPADLTSARRSSSDESVWQELNILVVDDDDGCRQGIATILSEQGHNIHTASRGYEALERANVLRRENKRLHLSILDFNMPDLTGIETFRQLVVMFPRLEAVFVSGDASETLEQEVRQVGGRMLVRKPLDVTRVRTVIHWCRGGDGFLAL